MRPPFKSNNTIANKNLTESSSDAVLTNLWVGNLTADVTELDLRNLFEKHGVVDTVTCYPSRSYAFVNMRRHEDAKRAKDSLQGVLLRGGSLKIDFAKPARPCKTLWVSGINMSTSKEDLEQEFSKFGKIEDFRFIRDKNTAYIDYARLDDASKALKAMNGKYKGGSVLRVDYLRSQSKRDPGHDFRDAKDSQHVRNMVPFDQPWLPPDAVNPIYNGAKRQQHNLPLEGYEEQPSNVLVISYPPVVHVDEQMLHNAMILFGEIDNITSFPSRNYSLVEFRSVEEAQLAKDGLRGRLFNDPRISIAFLNNEHAHSGPKPHGMYNEFPLDAYGHPILMPTRPFGPPDSFDPLLQGPEFNPMGPPNWRRSSPMSGPTRTSPGTWDVFDASQLHREPKRLRTDGNLPLREMNDQGVLGPDPYGGGARFPTQGAEKGRPGSDYIWRGVIAKGGTPVCHARCVPIKEWIGYDIPEVVNCSARTGLDMLAKHYTDAVGFDIVFFLPDSEEDFASYTEFVRYLGDRNRAGVAKFDDGTTLFLVPPSDFLTNVLNVSGPERLYGVVLKFPQPPSASSSAGPLSTQPEYIDKQQIPPQNEYNIVPSGEKVLQVDYSGVPHDDLKSNPKSTGPSHNPLAPPPPPPAVSTPTPQTGLSLTPELIATLASLAKGKLNGQQPSGAQSSLPAVAPPNERPPWEYETDPSNNTFHGQPHMLPDHQGYHSNMVNNAHLPAAGNFPPIQDYSFNMPQHEAVPSPMTNSISQMPQSGQFAVPVQANQQYLPNISQDTHHGYAFEQKPDAGSVLQTGANPYGANVYQPQRLGPAGPENPGMQLPEQMQQLQSALYAAGQPPSNFDADKNERYQSTLQFASNLLLQIHQQQPGTQSGQGSGGGSLH